MARILVSIVPVVLVAGAVTAPASATHSFDPSALIGELRLTQIASGLSSPVLVTHAGDGSGRLFIVEQSGRIKIRKNGVVLATPFLDISGSISNGGERGLLGLAFHPSFETNRKFYVNFTNSAGDTAINEYKASSTNPDRVQSGSGRRILTIDQPYSNHNGGGIAFGRDGYLYVGMGDGGSANDPGNRAQSLSSLLGKFLRIDVNGTSGGKQYRIPSSNPYVGRSGRDEIWSRGWRNPWRWSFDRLTGDLWVGDVGQSSWEEVDRAAWSGGAGKGKNYGWRIMEGRHCHIPSSGCSMSGLSLPIAEYGHTASNCSITGGYVYRGPAIDMRGGYFYADYCTGRIWAFRANAASPTSGTLIVNTDYRISSFGEDEAGELYVVDHDDTNGAVYRIDTRRRVLPRSEGGLG